MSTFADQLRALASDERATSKFSALVHLAADIHEMETDLIRSSARIEELEKALNLIASWGEGDEVNGSFDEPGSASIARDALRAEVANT